MSLEGNGHKHGNYHDYYTFHPADVRTSLLPLDIFQDLYDNNNNNDDDDKIFNVLDIGCNEGNLTIDMYNRIRSELSNDITIHIIGIDIDEMLIDRANKKDKVVVNSNSNSNDTIQFMTVDIMNNDSRSIISNRKYHFISIFSVTMWIHLNHGDDGLRNCLYNTIDLLTNKGSLLIEPQPWKCYKKAAKRLRKLGMPNPSYFGKLNINDIEKQITVMMMKSDKNNSDINDKLFTSYNTYGPDPKWGRTLILFHKSTIRKRKLDQE